MRLLLDTHVLLWVLNGSVTELGATPMDAILDAEDVHVSVVSIWEIEIKRGLGKLDAPTDVPSLAWASGFRPLLVGIEHTVAAGRLPLHHRDPFDRMLVAQARTEDLTIVTADKMISLYDVSVLAAG